MVAHTNPSYTQTHKTDFSRPHPGESWKAGNIDITGLLMVLTLKVTACSLNYMDCGCVAFPTPNPEDDCLPIRVLRRDGYYRMP